MKPHSTQKLNYCVDKNYSAQVKKHAVIDISRLNIERKTREPENRK